MYKRQVTAFICAFIVGVAIELLSWKLGANVLRDKYIINFHYQVIQYLLGFFAHFFPYFFVGQNLYLYDYLPAYYFGILAFGHALDLISTSISSKRSNTGYFAAVIFMIFCFYFFHGHSPLIYATEWTSSLCKRSKWLGSWDFYCNSLLLADSHYDSKIEWVNSRTCIQIKQSPIDSDLDLSSLGARGQNKHKKGFMTSYNKSYNHFLIPPFSIYFQLNDSGG